jgi:hypothetical protein
MTAKATNITKARSVARGIVVFHFVQFIAFAKFVHL